VQCEPFVEIEPDKPKASISRDACAPRLARLRSVPLPDSAPPSLLADLLLQTLGAPQSDLRRAFSEPSVSTRARLALRGGARSEATALLFPDRCLSASDVRPGCRHPAVPCSQPQPCKSAPAVLDGQTTECRACGSCCREPLPRQHGRLRAPLTVACDVAQFVHERTPPRPRVVMLLGSGHASITPAQDKVILHDDLPGAPLHSPLHIGLLEGVAVAVADPRSRAEGLSAASLRCPCACCARSAATC
jgi:hypothetical protein